MCDRIISARQQSLARQNSGGSNSTLDVDNDDFLHELLLNDLTTEQIRDTLIMLIAAGNDNNVNALGWSLDLLKKDEYRDDGTKRKLSWMQRMREEAKEMTNGGEIIKFDEINVCFLNPFYFVYCSFLLRIFQLFSII